MPRQQQRQQPSQTQEQETTHVNGKFPVDYEISILINEVLHKTFPLYLTDKLSYHEYLEGSIREHVVDGDYICYSILRVCEILRSKDPIFRNTTSLDIAKFILKTFPKKSDMVQEPKLVDVGFLSFKLNGKWMAERIRKNLIDGIDAWAPILPPKKVVVDFPEQDIEAESVRSTYLRDLLVRIFEYSGVKVCRKTHDEHSLEIVKNEFPEEETPIRGFLKWCIMNKRTGTSLFVSEEKQTWKSEPNNAHKDLAALWCGGNVQKANWIIYVTPIRQRDYILKCLDAAKVFVNEDQTSSILYLGYQTSVDEKEKLASLWLRSSDGGLAINRISTRFHDSWILGMENFGYTSPESFLECIIRYNYLKTYTYAGCTIEDEEIFEVEGNNFVSLLYTRFSIRRTLMKYPPKLESNKALVGEAREFGLHLLRFTDVMREAILNLTPHSLCDYLYNLQKKFNNLTNQFRHTLPSETLVLLCEATDVVLKKGMDLLRITPESSNDFLSRESLQSGKPLTRDHYISLPTLSPNLSSRFEIFSMFVGVDFENANLFGEIKVTDTYGVHPDKWCSTDLKGYGQVAYFTHYWYDPMVIRSISLFPLPFGDPASRVSVPFSETIKIVAHLWVSSKEKNKVYQLCNVDDDKGVIRLYDFWRGKHNMDRSTFQVDGVNGCVIFYYYLIKDAVDTQITLSYVGHPRVRGQIRAYYGDHAFDSSTDYDKNFYKALIFTTRATNLREGNLPLNKSTLAVPKNGVLVFECFFEDVDTGKTIMKGKRDYHEESEGQKSEWTISGKNCCFILTVNWIGGRH